MASHPKATAFPVAFIFENRAFIMPRIFAALCLLALLWLLSACSALPTPAARQQTAESLASAAGWGALDIAAGDFQLRAYVPQALSAAPTLTVYIEGDGLAWVNRSTPSLDPTPANPVALKLALRDDRPSVYLARPCQYESLPGRPTCGRQYWTSHRFAPEVIASVNGAIDQLKNRYAADALILVGYSGGGAVALLAAASRKDVARVITVAGNLDHATWTATENISPLTGSLNPADVAADLAAIPQTHLVGGRDRTVPEYVARSYAARSGAGSRVDVIVIPEFDHHCCWEQQWPQLKQRAAR